MVRPAQHLDGDDALVRQPARHGRTAEPIYAHYLKVTGIRHPGREDVLASQPTDWREVAAQLTGPVPGNQRIWYQKHMAHHLLPVIGRDWLDGLAHAFLIREPDEMLASLVKS